MMEEGKTTNTSLFQDDRIELIFVLSKHIVI